MRRLPLLAVLGPLLLFAASTPLAAQSPAPAPPDLARKAQEAESLLARGRVVEAIDALDEAAVALWERSPLVFRRGIWVAEAAGYGVYTPRPNGNFAPGEPMQVYAEPVGFGWRRNGELYVTDIAADVVFRSPAGKELYRKDEFQLLQLSSRVRNREFMCNFTYSLTGVPKGDYIATTLRDRVSGKTGSFTFPFTIR